MTFINEKNPNCITVFSTVNLSLLMTNIPLNHTWSGEASISVFSSYKHNVRPCSVTKALKAVSDVSAVGESTTSTLATGLEPTSVQTLLLL